MSALCYTPRLDAALGLAASAFRDIRRKGSDVPYLAHLMQVAVWVAEHGGSEDQIIAALLHDYLEDIDGADPLDLERRFGRPVREMVEALSDAIERPKPPWRARKEAYIARLGAKPAEVKLISAADKLHNAQSIYDDYRRIGDVLWERFSAPRPEVLWYYRAIVAALGTNWRHALLDRLRGVVVATHELVGEPWP